MSETYMYDVAVLGAGPGGYETAIRLRQLGLTVALIEAGQLGGTCLNRGCMPTKALLHGAKMYHDCLHMGELGITVQDVRFDYAAMAARKDVVVARMRAGVESLLKGYGVQIVAGRGRLTDAHRIAVGDRDVTARSVVIATGSRPVKPPVDGMDGPDVLTSDEFLAMDTLADEWVVIGGGVIGIELSTVISQLGRKVTVLEMMTQILPGVDDEIRKWLLRDLRRRGVTVVTGVAVRQVGRHDGRLTVTYEKDGVRQSCPADRCLVAAGRRPNTEDIGLKEVGIAMEGRFIAVDRHMRTNIPDVYAIGDVTGKLALAHVASAQGMVAAAEIAGHDTAMDYTAVPACIYTDPEIAYVGASASQLKAAGVAFDTGTFSVLANGRAVIEQCEGGVACVYSDPATHQILGGQVMAPNATEMIGELTALIHCHGTLSDLGTVIHPHPTVAECLQCAGLDTDGRNLAALPRRGR